jgi:NodT family efflux transporter outer membrane factor (OMF) lipoprotein
LEYKDVMWLLYLRISVITVTASIVLILSGCAVGPDFHAPEAPSAKAYTATPLPPETADALGVGGAIQRFIPGQDIPLQWWTLFRSETLDQLIRQALTNSPTLAAAEATLRQSQEILRATIGSALFPRVDANASVSREKNSGAAVGQPNAKFPPFTLYNTSVSISYALDIAGGARREMESLQAQVDFQRFQREAAYLTLTSNIVTAAIREASVRAQIAAMQEIITAQQRQLELVERQYQLGAVAYSDVLAQRAQLAQTKATLPPLEKDLAQTRHFLAVLAGKLPVEVGTLPEFSLEGLTLPRELPLSLPSSLVRQRPDIQASEELLHAASAQIGVATANLYPQITLSGSFGYTALEPANLFNPSAAVWSLGAGLLQPLFRGGELTAKRRAAIAAYDQAAAQYRATVLQAFQNVADVLRALELDAQALRAQAEAESAAKDSLALTQKQFQFGAISYLSLLNAQRQYQQARIGLVQAQAVRFADTAALFQALGGGWWNRTPQTNAASMLSTESDGNVREHPKP